MDILSLFGCLPNNMTRDRISNSETTFNIAWFQWFLFLFLFHSIPVPVPVPAPISISISLELQINNALPGLTE